jgi:hypothetical protein
MQWLTVRRRAARSRHPLRRRLRRRSTGSGEKFPGRLPRGLNVDDETRNRLGSGNLDPLARRIRLPTGLEVAEPASHIADDLDRLVMLDQALSLRVHAGALREGIGVEDVGMTGELRLDVIFQQAMNQDHVAADQLLLPGHGLLGDLSVMGDELEIERRDQPAGVAFAD